MAGTDLDHARKRLDDECGQIRRHFDKIHTAFDQVISAKADDDIYDRLEQLEKVVKEVRDGGIIGSGANGHRRALKDYKEALAAQGGKA